MIDAENRVSRHLCIIIFSSILTSLLWFLGIRLGRVIAAIPFIILFFVMIIGPIKILWPSIGKNFSKTFPINWRAELGIWFAIWSVIHILFVFRARNWAVLDYILGMSPWAFGAFVAVFMAIILAAISCKKAIAFLGIKSWKWLQNYGTYAIFWLTIVHVIDRALLRPGFPSSDPLHWIYLIMSIIVPILQIAAFSKIVSKYRKTGKYPSDLI